MMTLNLTPRASMEQSLPERAPFPQGLVGVTQGIQTWDEGICGGWSRYGKDPVSKRWSKKSVLHSPMGQILTLPP